MGGKDFDRVFNRVAGQKAKAIDEEFRELDAAVNKPSTAGEGPPDAAKEILQAWKDKDFFRLLQLPYPTADALGRPIWACTNSDISKAYRKLSVFVHPDKNSTEDARQAFEALNQAHRTLKDPDKLADVLKAAAERAVEQQERQDAAATMEERIQLNAQKVQQSKQLQKEQTQSFQQEILSQMQKRQQEAQRRRQLASKYKREQEEAEQLAAQELELEQAARQAAAPAQAAGQESDGEEERRRRAANMNRKRKRQGQQGQQGQEQQQQGQEQQQQQEVGT